MEVILSLNIILQQTIKYKVLEMPSNIQKTDYICEFYC